MAPVAGLRPAAPASARGYPASQPPAQILPGPGAEDSQLPDLALYERLIGDGIAAADARGSAVDHVTARRLAICLAARPQRRSSPSTWSASSAPGRSATR